MTSQSQNNECTCPLAGHCDRHNVYKTEHWHHLCQTRQDYRQAWDDGRGPGQQRTEAETLRQRSERIVCPHKSNNECGIVSSICGQAIAIADTTCIACTNSPRPQRLNTHTLMLSLVHKPILDEAIANQIIDGSSSAFGTKLSNTLSIFFQKSEGCGCKGYQDILDLWTPSHIRKNLDTVIDWLQKEAKTRGLPFFRPAVRFLLLGLLKQYPH
jgi:hypothetical protein